MDILIYAKPEQVEHKMIENVNTNEVIYCYWTVGVHPSLKSNKIINKVCFSDGNKIFAEGDYIGNDYEPTERGEKKVICFEPLKRTNKKQPKKPPTRGWCYINV